MRSFKLAAAALRRDLVAQGMTPLYPGQPVVRPVASPRLEPVPHIGRLVRTHDEALAWVLRWQRPGVRVEVAALRRGFLVFRAVA